MPEESRRTLTIEEAAKMLGISRSCAYAAARTGEIPVIKIGRRLLVPKVAFDQFLDIADVDKSS